MSSLSIIRVPEAGRSSGKVFAFTALRVAVGCQLLYLGVAGMIQANTTSASCLPSTTWLFEKVFPSIATAPWALHALDIGNVLAPLVLGLCLIPGFSTRSASILSAGLFTLFYMANPAIGAAGNLITLHGNVLMIDRNLLEAALLVAVAGVRPGSLYGLNWLYCLNRLCSRDQPLNSGAPAVEERQVRDVLLDRRGLLTHLAGIPVLGALAVAASASAALGQEPTEKSTPGATSTAAQRTRPTQSSHIVSIRDYERLAPTKMPSSTYEFIAGGAGDDQTVYWNQAAYQRLVLRPNAGVDVLKIDTRIQLLGRTMPHPIMLSPTSDHGALNPEGEKATARGAGAANATMVVSTFATEQLEDIAKAATSPLWHATYIFKDKAHSGDLIHRAEAAGFQAMVMPIDTPVIGPRDREERTDRYDKKPFTYQTYPIDYYRYPASWADVEWFAAQTKLPLFVKGILSPDDAERAIKAGARGVFVSNHGGRNIDTVPATIDVLASIVDQVAGRVPIVVDGGIRRGTDVLKALAYGATAVSIGRPYLYGLAVNGSDGVTGVINILRNELEMAMANVGRPTISSIDRSVVAGHLDFPNYTAPGQFWPN